LFAGVDRDLLSLSEFIEKFFAIYQFDVELVSAIELQQQQKSNRAATTDPARCTAIATASSLTPHHMLPKKIRIRLLEHQELMTLSFA
jgi:hypothetical protein